jgi:serine protease Do
MRTVKRKPQPPSSNRFQAICGRNAVSRLILSFLALQLAATTLMAQPRSTRADVLEEGHHKNGAVTLRAFAPVVEANRSSVVLFERAGQRLALGTVLTETGLVLTKASEVAGDEFTCRLDEATWVRARPIRIDDINDIALIQVDASGLRPVVWSSEDPAIGQWVVTPGLALVPEAVGVLSAAPRRIQHRRALIGILLDLNSRQPRVAGLMEGLGAEKARLEAGDLVLAVNGSSVTSREELIGLLRQFREGQVVRLRIQRDEQTLEMEVELMVPRLEADGGSLDRSERMNRMGSDVSGRADGFDEVFTHDTVLQAWQCGGPLLNLEGLAVGVNIARAGRVASYALPARLIRSLLDEWISVSDEVEALTSG